MKHLFIIFNTSLLKRRVEVTRGGGVKRKLQAEHIHETLEFYAKYFCTYCVALVEPSRSWSQTSVMLQSSGGRETEVVNRIYRKKC